MTLATLDDYELRHGTPPNPAQVDRLLADASSLIRRYGGHISLVTDDEITLDGDGTRRIYLPERPVVSVTSVTVAGEVLDTDGWRAWPWGGLDRRDGRPWPCEPQSIDVVYTHGGPVPDWVVNRACGMVQRATRPETAAGVRSEDIDGYRVAYVTSAAGVTLWLTETELNEIASLKGPAIT